jgi:hypothetical protein
MTVSDPPRLVIVLTHPGLIRRRGHANDPLRFYPPPGSGPGGVRFTALAAEARQLERTLPGILRGRPGRLATERNGYTSRNAKRVDLELSCGFTVDGELVDPWPGRILSITAENRVRFVRA